MLDHQRGAAPPDHYPSRPRPGMMLAVGLTLGVAGILIWALGDILLLVFAGILVAAVLDAAVNLLPGKLARPWRLALVVITSFMAIGAAAYWAGSTAISEFRTLQDTVLDQAAELGRAVNQLDLPFEVPSAPAQFTEMVPDRDAVMGLASTALGTLSGIATSGFTVILLGVFLAISPSSYQNGIVALVPMHRRERTAEVLTETGKTLQAWLVGQLAAMAIVGVSVFAFLWLLQIPNALALAGLSALLNFIPFLGPVLAAVPVGLVALMQGNTTFLIVMAGFLVIQWIEGYLITPLIQQKAVDLPPAHSLAFLMIMGALFGELGVALATPLLAIIRVLGLRLYVEDVLEKNSPEHQ